MARKSQKSKQRALNAFDTAADDEYYIKGLRQQQDIDLEHIADDRLRNLLNNEVNSSDDEEIDSDLAMGSDSDISLGDRSGSDLGDSLDEEELRPLSEVWDLNDSDSGESNQRKSLKERDVSEGESLSESESEDESLSESSSDLIDSDEESFADDDSDFESTKLRQALKTINAQPLTSTLADAAEENPFALPAQQLSATDFVPDVDEGKTLSVPAPKRIKERAERSAAYSLTKAEVNKWQDQIQANRQAEHLQFPLNKPTAEMPSPFEASKSKTSLESKVNELLTSSSLIDEQAAATFEEMAPSNLSIEELRERRKELRRMRDLMYREEQRAKRIKKIKSKSYRKIHKKEREKMAELEAAENSDDNDDVFKAERDRALERATLRHKSTNSKWAKRLLDHNLTRDAKTRAELEEMLRQSDELRQKIRGNEVESDEENVDMNFDEEDEPAKVKGVAGMKFMQEAEKRHREENKRMMNDEESGDEVENIGRRSYDPVNQKLKRDIEELERSSDSEHESTNKKQKINKGEVGSEKVEFVREPKENFRTARKPEPQSYESVEENPWLAAANKSSTPNTVKLSAVPKRTTNTNTTNSKTIAVENTFGDSIVKQQDLTLQQQDLVKQAFAGDDVVAEFEAAKRAEIEEDGDKEIDETLPGWGNWSNEKPRIRKIRHIAGINEKKRKDYKKQNVIISEKVNKKTAKYNASAVPFPFENKQQYERSLRMPIGQEWVSKDTFQRQTKPRVLVKRATVIDPIEKPKGRK